MSEDLVQRSATELLQLLRERQLSAVELTRVYLERIERLNPRLGAYVLVRAEAAMVAAAEADARIARDGDDLPPLLGLPVSIKDLADTADLPTSYGSRAFADFVPERDAEVVARLKRAGAIVLGKTSTPEFGLRPTTEFGLHPPARNPWDLARSAGGSSGGAAAAAAASLCALAHGSDGGGSIRIPASLCGLVGLKPSRGRISVAPRHGEGWAGLSTQGPLSQTVADAALFLDATAGPALGDPYWAPPPDEPFSAAARRAPGQLRIGWATATSEGAADAEIAAATQVAVETLARLGHAVEETTLETDGMWDSLWQIAAANIAALPITTPDLLEPHARATYERGRALSAADYVSAVMRMHQAARRLVAHLDRFDLLVTPTLPHTAPPLGTLGADPATSAEEIHAFIPFTFPFNVTGQPAISLPLAQSADGLPIGVQLVGRPAGETTLLAAAAQLERALPWRARRPPIA